jgi:hypothetical protein
MSGALKLVCGEDNGDGGKLLIYAPEENLADGAAPPSVPTSLRQF